MMKKRIISMLLIAAMVISLFPSTIMKASAEQTSQPIISVEDVWAATGSTVEVNINISGNPGLYGATLTVSWAEGLTLVDAESGPVFRGLSYQEPSRYVSTGTNFIWYGTRLHEVRDGTMLTLTFEVAENVADSSKLEISLSGNGFTDANDNIVVATLENGFVRILNYLPGDTDSNKVIDVQDLIALAKYISDNCTTDPDGFNITIKVEAADVNDDGELDTRDLVLIAKYISDGCVTDPEGFNVTLKPSTPKCTHTMEAIPFKAATCMESGNGPYYRCTTCDKYYSDANGTAEIDPSKMVIPATGHDVVIDPAIAPSYSTPGWTEGSHCANCGEVFVEQERIEPIEGFSITYDIAGSIDYLAKQPIENPNPYEYNPEQNTIVLIDLEAPAGFTFLGWYDAPQAAGGNRVTQIPKGSTGNKKLYAHWNEIVYDINYKLYQTPLGPIENEKYLHYTVSKGLQDLPNPELYNYIFLGWYMEDGTEVTNIPVGTTGDINLNAYWTSKRNLAKTVGDLDSPFVIENTDTDVFYFVYELGTIENVPLSEPIWTIQSVAGLAQQHSVEVTTSISEEKASEISEMISRSTVDSATWTLSKEWNDSTSVNEEWAKECGLEVEEANEMTKSSSGTYSVTDSKGGSDTTTTTDGTTTVTYASQNDTSGNGAHFDAKISGSYSNEGNLSSAVAGTFEVSGEIGGGYEQHKETDKHTGTDTTGVDTTVTDETKTWNKETTSSTTKAESESESVRKAMSQVISNTKGYGKSYSEGGANSEAQEFSSTDSTSSNTSSTLTYFSSETKTTTTTYSTDGKSEGCYRLVIAGTVHVFGVVGYDVSTKSYFTYTYNVLDDKTYEFLDYSPNLKFDDNENCALPFEIPYEVFEYVAEKTVTTVGLQFTTNSEDGTATVIGYSNDAENDVIIPSYITSGDTAYKVTELSAKAFAGKPIRAIILSDFIDEIPTGAFKNCTELEEISGSFTVIGDEAFSGCTSLEGFRVSSYTTEIGTDAFLNVPSIVVHALNENQSMELAKNNLGEDADAEELQKEAQYLTNRVANEAVASGAKQMTVDLNGTIAGAVFTFEVGPMSSFELLGNKNVVYKDLRIKSDAATTVLKNLTIDECTRIPLEISSEKLVMEVVKVTSTGYALLLSGEAPTITLIRDNSLKSAQNAVVCKCPTITSEIIQQAVGTLAVSGNVYVYGTDDQIRSLRNSAYLSVKNGQIIPISYDEYSQYIKGSFTINFDANGGTVNVLTKTAFCGSPVGELPVPAREGFDFVGWYTADDVLVTEDDAINAVGEITLIAKWEPKAFGVTWYDGMGYTITVCRINSPLKGASTGELESGSTVYYGDMLEVTYTRDDYYFISNHGVTEIAVEGDVTEEDIYAVAELNPVSDWVLASEVPEDAEVLDQKWTYTETTNTESRETSLDGYTQIGSYWVQSGSGSANYASFPGGFDTGNSIYNSFMKSAYSNSETATTKRTVSNSWAGYVYWHWMYNVGTSTGFLDRAIYYQYGYAPAAAVGSTCANYKYQYFQAFTSGTAYSPEYSNWNQGHGQYLWYNCTGVNARSSYFYRFDYYTSRYTDYYKMFQYQKVEDKESDTEVTEGGAISNVQEWVQYRAK